MQTDNVPCLREHTLIEHTSWWARQQSQWHFGQASPNRFLVSPRDWSLLTSGAPASMLLSLPLSFLAMLVKIMSQKAEGLEL